MPTVVNWRVYPLACWAEQPVVSHESAVIWNCLQPKLGRRDSTINSSTPLTAGCSTT